MNKASILPISTALLHSRSKDPVTVIYHKNCADGLVAGFLFKLYCDTHNTEVSMIAAQYGDPLPANLHSIVYLVDFSYPPAILNELLELPQVKEVYVLDHHDSAAKDYGWGVSTHTSQLTGKVANLWFEQNHSGAGMANLYLSGISYEFDKLQVNPRLASLVRAIEDRDLWRFHHVDTKAYYELLCGIPGIFGNYGMDTLSQILNSVNDWEGRLLKARYAVEHTDNQVTAFVEKAKLLKFRGWTVPFVNAPKWFASEIGDRLGKEHPFAVAYSVSNEGAFFSLRSNKETGVPVNNICKHYGGGGHANAAAFMVDLSTFVDILKELHSELHC